MRKKNIKVDIIRRIRDWIFVPFAKSSFLVKAEDFDRVVVLKEKTENTINEHYANAETESASVEQVKTPFQNEGNVKQRMKHRLLLKQRHNQQLLLLQ